MRKFLVLLLCMFFLPWIVWGAAPKVVSDPAPVSDGVTTFKIFINGTMVDQLPVVNNAVDYSLANVPIGTSVLKAQFCNAWGDCSVDSSPLDITRKIPAAPVLIFSP